MRTSLEFDKDDQPADAGRESTRLSDGALPPVSRSVRTKHLCPYCGALGESVDRACAQCGLQDTPTTRQATRTKIGPWYVLQSRNPAAPGMNFETLLSLVEKGRVTPRSVVRGPTTHQLWRQAGRVKGLSRLFGACWGCGQEISRSSALCPRCQRSQLPPVNANALLEEAVSTTPTLLPSPGSDSPSAAADSPLVGIPSSAPDEVDSETVSMGMAAFQFPPDYAVGAKPRTGRRIFFGLVLTIVLCGGALFLAGFPHLPLQDRVSGWWKGDGAPPNQASPTPPITSAAPIGMKLAPPTPPTQIVPHDTVVVPPTPLPTPMMAPPPATAPAPVSTTKTTVIPSPEPPIAPAPDVPSPAASPADPDAARRMAFDLYGQAIGAETREDYASAVKLYQQIKRLPESAWPTDLSFRLSRAQTALDARHSARESNPPQ